MFYVTSAWCIYKLITQQQNLSDRVQWKCTYSNIYWSCTSEGERHWKLLERSCLEKVNIFDYNICTLFSMHCKLLKNIMYMKSALKSSCKLRYSIFLFLKSWVGKVKFPIAWSMWYLLKATSGLYTNRNHRKVVTFFNFLRFLSI